MKITAVILTYNEEKRITTTITHAKQWADEVLIADKGSTDGTQELCRMLGARVETIPFSRQGHESMEMILNLATHAWTWAFTPGEVPTRKCIEVGKSMISDDLDCIIVPHRLYSFGVHDKRSPWSLSGQPRLLCRERVTFTGIAHDPVRATRTAVLPYADDCYVLHQTHATADGFIRAHADYAINEAANGDPQDVIGRALHEFNAWDNQMMTSEELLPQLLGWKIYWLSVALHAWERGAESVPAQYNVRAAGLLAEQWQMGEHYLGAV